MLDATERLMLYAEELPILHLYAQASYHGQARIIANPAGLRALADAITVALDAGRAEARVYVIDGEGYGLQVERTNDVGLNYTRRPYHPEWGGETATEYTDRLRAELEELECALAPAPEDGSHTPPASDGEVASPKGEDTTTLQDSQPPGGRPWVR
jgi:hypothetical protein